MMFKTKGNKTDCSLSEVVTCYSVLFFLPIFSKNIKFNTLNSVIIGITISHFILMLYYVKFNTQ